MTTFYHPGKPGEVSHAAARAYIDRILSNPFTTGALLAQLSDAGRVATMGRTSARPLCAPGSMEHYLRAAALREATQGEACHCGAQEGTCLPSCSAYLYTIICHGRHIDIYRGRVSVCAGCGSRFEAADNMPAMLDTVTAASHSEWRAR